MSNGTLFSLIGRYTARTPQIIPVWSRRQIIVEPSHVFLLFIYLDGDVERRYDTSEASLGASKFSCALCLASLLLQ